MNQSGKSRTLFFDRSIGRSVPDALSILGLSVECHDDHFDQKELDDIWMPQIAAQGWVLCTQDYSHHKRKNMAEAIAIRQHEIECFYLWGADAPKWEILRAFSRGYDRIIEILDSERPPYIFRVHKDGKTTEVRLP